MSENQLTKPVDGPSGRTILIWSLEFGEESG
jgi:hypothetical protein